MNKGCEIIYEAYKNTHKSKNYGDTVPATSIADSLTFETSQVDPKYENFDSNVMFYFDPTEGGGGEQATGFSEEKLEQFARSNGVSPLFLEMFFTTYPYSLFIPKTKQLAEIALNPEFQVPVRNMTPEIKAQYKTARNSGPGIFPFLGIAATPESYRFLIKDSWEKLPDGVIGNASWDYSFHAGEGTVDSFIAALGTSESDVRNKLTSALKVIDAEYVGSSTEAKFQQRYQVRSVD
jgi:hypothetical protein